MTANLALQLDDHCRRRQAVRFKSALVPRCGLSTAILHANFLVTHYYTIKQTPNVPALREVAEIGAEYFLVK